MSTTNNNSVAPQPIDKALALVVVDQQQQPTAVTTGRNNKRLILFVIGSIMLLALAIGLGVGLSSSSKGQTNNTPTTTTDSLALLCNTSDLDACRNACKDYMCCFSPQDNEDCSVPANSCGFYAPCYILVNETDSTNQQQGGNASLPGANVSTGELKEPTDEVREICNSDYSSSTMTCEEACWEANCCYETGETACYQEYAEICDMWKDAGCFAFSDPFGGEEATIPGGNQVLEDGEQLEEPDANVETICNSGYKEGGITCEEACNKAACCYWAGEDSCYDDNAEVCEMWTDAGCFAFSVQYEQDVP